MKRWGFWDKETGFSLPWEGPALLRSFAWGLLVLGLVEAGVLFWLGWTGRQQPDPGARRLAWSLMLVSGLALLQAVAAVGLLRRRRWAYGVSLVLMALYVPYWWSGTLLGGAGLFLLLQKDVRPLFEPG